MKYKVGDTVKIKSEEWYRSNADSFGDIRPLNDVYFVSEMSQFLGQTHVVAEVKDRSYRLKDIPWHWADYMLEDPIIEDVEFEEIVKPSSDDPYNWLF